MVPPFLDVLGHDVGSGLFFKVAWSFWNDLTGVSEQVAGPFYDGTHCIGRLSIVLKRMSFSLSEF